MAERSSTKESRILTPVKFGQYQLLSDEKLGRVFDLIDGVRVPDAKEAAVLAEAKQRGVAKDKLILALYDRLGGGIKTADGRKVLMGTFFDFENKVVIENVVLKEENFDDQFILVRKPRISKKQSGEDIRKKAEQVGSKKEDEEVL